MKTHIISIIGSALLITTSVQAEDAKEAKPEKELKAQTVCPVMGGKIVKEHFVDHEGQRIYVCCPGCIETLKKDPETYIKKMAENGEKPAQLQTTCPVMGGKIKKDSYVDVKGKRIYMCCNGCTAALKKDPDKYIKKLEDAGITIEDTPTEKK